MKCPLCGAQNKNESFKSWHYNTYEVSRFKCSECGNMFNQYVDGEKRFTIPKDISGD